MSMKYEIFPRQVILDGDVVNTFDIVATDPEGNVQTFEDVTTFRNELEKFVKFLNEENVSLKCFKIFLELFIESI